MTDTFENQAVDLLDMIKRMEQHSAKTETIRFAVATYLRATYKDMVADDDDYIRKENAFEYVRSAW